MNLFPILDPRPKRFFFSAAIIGYHTVRGIQNNLRGTVILLQFDNHSLRIHLFKVQNIADIGSTEFIDGLVIISHDTQIPIFIG